MWHGRPAAAPVRIVVLNQTFPPDVVSSAQHAGDLARELRALGHEVTIIASRRAYDEPSVRFPSTRDWYGVEVIRVGCSAFGKGARWRRAADFGTFLWSCLFRLMLLPRCDVVVAMTSPPLVSFLAAVYARLRGGHLVLWVMDLNPDEAIAAGWLKERSVAARVLEWCLTYSLRWAERIVVLDRFMKERVEARFGDPQIARKLIVIAPWSHDSIVRYDSEGRRAFRRMHGIDNKFVVMYSGNHSPCHPLQTLLEAAQRLNDHSEIAFCFVGGGSEFGKVKQFARDHGLNNVVCLPYQPLGEVSASLSAADLHAVVMGDPFVGILHPCKIYNVLRLGIPCLYIGAPASHVTDLMSKPKVEDWARSTRHGDADGVVAHILQAAAAGPRRCQSEVRLSEMFSQQGLVKQLVDVIENAGAGTMVEPIENAYAGR